MGDWGRGGVGTRIVDTGAASKEINDVGDGDEGVAVSRARGCRLQCAKTGVTVDKELPQILAGHSRRPTHLMIKVRASPAIAILSFKNRQG